MGVPIATDLATLLLGVKTLLENATIVADNTCYIATRDIPEPEFPSSAQFVVIRPDVQNVNQGYVAGGGTDLMYFEGFFLAEIYSQSNLDEPPRDELWLTDSASGVWPLVKSVTTTLQMAVGQPPVRLPSRR